MWVFHQLIIYFALFFLSLPLAVNASAFPERLSSSITIGINHSSGLGNLGYALLAYQEQFNSSQDERYHLEYQFDISKTWICANEDIQIQNYARQSVRQFLQQFACFEIDFRDQVFYITVKKSVVNSAAADHGVNSWCRCDSAEQLEKIRNLHQRLERPF